MPEFENIRKRVRFCLLTLNAHDTHLLNVEAHERSLTFRLGFYLQSAFPDWDVDCEYNRDGANTKQVDGRNRLPDIIIHSRGTEENVLAIEAKPQWRNHSEEEDSLRIQKLIDELGYQAGLALVFFQNGEHELEWIQSNQEILKETLV